MKTNCYNRGWFQIAGSKQVKSSVIYVTVGWCNVQLQTSYLRNSKQNFTRSKWSVQKPQNPSCLTRPINTDQLFERWLVTHASAMRRTYVYSPKCQRNSSVGSWVPQWELTYRRQAAFKNERNDMRVPQELSKWNTKPVTLSNSTWFWRVFHG